METGIHKNVHHSGYLVSKLIRIPSLPLGKCWKEKLMIKALLLSAGLQWKASMIAVKSKCPISAHQVEDVDYRALVEWEESEDDGRPDFSERKRCNFERGWLATCPSKLLDVCKSKDEIERMQFWELFTDKFEYENWDMDKCPAVK